MEQEGYRQKDFHGTFRKYSGYISPYGGCYAPESSQGLPQACKKKGCSPIYRANNRGKAKAHVVCDASGRPIRALLAADPVSDSAGAALLPTLSNAGTFCDRNHDVAGLPAQNVFRGCTVRHQHRHIARPAFFECMACAVP